MKYKTLHHVTAAKNMYSILENGLDPAMSQGLEERVWFTTWANLPHTLAHMSARLRLPVNALIVVTVRVQLPQAVHFRLEMWVSYQKQRRAMRIEAGHWALTKWEHQRQGVKTNNFKF